LSQEAREDIPIEEITVTGSRIQKANLEASSPVTELDAEQLDLTGITRVEDVLGSMPQVYLDQSSGQSIESEGTATLQLRNLGVSRTLVLVNGKRLPINSPASDESGPDLNFIPMQLVERVEILTGGASSTYGSDAVAGVVNFIMNDQFEGVMFDVQTSFYRHDNDGNRASESTTSEGVAVPSGTSTDGDITSFTLLVGGNLADDRGNITAYASYRDIEAVTQDLRDYSACANTIADDGTLDCGGSATNASGSFYFENDGFAAPYHVEGNEFLPGFGTLFNFAAPSYYQRPDERYTLGAFAHYNMHEKAELYSELMFMDNRTLAQIAPAGEFFSNLMQVNCDSPLLSDQQRATIGCATDPDGLVTSIFGRRNVEGGPRISDLRHTTYRVLGGFRGEINETWRYDASYQFAEVDMNNPNLNYTDTARMQTALLVDPATGDCFEDAERCAPWNIWQTGGVTQEATDYFAQVYFANGQTDQQVISAYVQGSLGDYGVVSPFAENGIEAVFGYEFREENLTLLYSDNARAGEVGGLGAALVNVDGGYDVNELFLEASIPLVEGARFAEQVTLDLGYRYSDYSSGKTTDTYKAAASWEFSEDVKLRASYQRAVRAPNIVDQFQPQAGTLFAMNEDPCTKTNPGDTVSVNGYTFEQCARSGVTQAIWDLGGPQSSPANQYNALIGGSTELEPESSDTYSVGFIVTPRFIDGLAVSVDWYDIDVQDAIAEIEPETTLTECIENNVFCDKVFRGVNDSLWLGLATPTNGIVALSQNIGFFRVQGVDLEAAYSFGLGDMGTVSLNNQLGWIDSWEQEEYVGAGSQFCEGLYGGACGPPTVEVRNRFQAIWDTPWDVTLNLGWRHTGEVEQDPLSTDLPPTTLEAQNYIDLSGSWAATEWLTIRGGINNVLDKEPPFVPQGVTARENGNTYPSAYDHLGQYVFLAASVNLL
ncbi:MAG: TonB-dependent receptor plug domain-containing protein, partial [Woeseiaceae bacterium]